MTVQTVSLGGRKFVIVPEKDYRRLRAKAEGNIEQERGDLAEHRRRMKEPGGKTLAQLRRELRQ
jgi:hypothetical protein